MKKLTILASVIASLCLAFGFVTMPKAYEIGRAHV